jgi:5-methylcytosine-specific restriction endonuclease McrA
MISVTKHFEKLAFATDAAWEEYQSALQHLQDSEQRLAEKERQLNLREQQLDARERAWQAQEPERRVMLGDRELAREKEAKVARKRIFIRAFRQAAKADHFQGTVVMICHGCDSYCASLFSCTIKPAEPPETPLVFCKRCATHPSVVAKHAPETWLTAPKFSRQKVGCFVRAAGFQMSTQCYCCTQEIRVDHFHAAHNVARDNGGPAIMENLRASCAACNGAASTAVFDDYCTTERALEGNGSLPVLMDLVTAEKALDFLFGVTPLLEAGLLRRSQCLSMPDTTKNPLLRSIFRE